ncbi:MAG: SUMF1/EgtB/PvdO family nonheme iron enzyme [Bryobacteraceae bacterium]|jgi:formylglycine-generating enzyme required for sulfatase activity
MVDPVTVRFLVLLMVPVFCLAQPCDTAPARKRYALIVGNGNYDPLPRVATAEHDSQVMKEALERVGFIVTEVENATMPELYDFKRGEYTPEFLEKVQAGDVVFFYYSGHVVQAEGEDFILPVNFDPSRKVTEAGSAFSLNRFLEDLNKKEPWLTILMIEGPHPVGASITGFGLVVPELSDNGEILFAMAAEQGKIANYEPGVGPSLFTSTVAELLGHAGRHPSEVFDEARQEVSRRSGGGQILGVNDQLAGGSRNFCFLEAIVKPPPPSPEPIVIFEEVPATPSNKRDHEEYVRIPHGTFKMGCVPTDTKCNSDEKPQHEVTLAKDFWIGRNEVQVGSFQLFWKVDKKKQKLPRSAPPQDYNGWKVNNLPMVRVTWEEASDYCSWVGGRLPTEAEWEYAARAGASDEIYPLNSENSREKANFAGVKGNDIYLGVAPVRKFDENKFHLFDMSGNVWEWVSDWYGEKYYAESPAVDPKGPIIGKKHIIRGGSFESDWREHLRLSLRMVSPKDEDFKTGFRCVLEDGPVTRRLLGVP